MNGFVGTLFRFLNANGNTVCPQGAVVDAVSYGRCHKLFWLLLIFASFQTQILMAFNYGDRVQSTTSGLNIHSSDYLSSSVIAQANLGDQGTVEGGPYYDSVSGYYFYYVAWDAHSAGYSVQNYLQLVTATPTISSVSPNPATGANSSQTLTIYGSGFVSGAQVKLSWPAVGVVSAGSTTLSASFISSSQLQISPTYANDPGTWTAQVINPGSITSSTYNFAVQAPYPVITSLSPSSATAGGSGFTLTVNGSTFDQSSVILWNGTSLSTSHTVSSGGLTTAIYATIPASYIASAGTATVTVYTPSPGGGTSSGATFTINAGTPTISSISPNPATGANSSQTLTIYGSGFVSGAQVELSWPAVGVVSAGSTTLSASFISSSQLQISPTYANDPGTWTAQVINPGSITSSTYNFAVQAPLPVITSLSQSSATAGSSAFTLTVNGTTFNQSSVILWSGTSLSTSHTVSSGGLTTAIYATIPASYIASAGTATITVYTPSPGGGTSSGATFTINAGTPTITSVSPNPATGANSAQTLTIYGSGFVSPAQVKLSYPAVGVVSAGSQTFSATFISSSQLQISPTYANDPGTWTAQIINPGSITSSTYSFAVQAPIPAITSLSPSSATAGGSGFTLTVNGSTFDQSSVILWNGTSLSTSHTVSSGGLTTAIYATIPASDIASVGSETVTVYTPSPGGGTSSGVSFSVGSVTQTDVLGADFNTGGGAVSWSQESSGGRAFAFIKATQDNINNLPLPSNMSAQPSGFTIGMLDYADPDDYFNPTTQTFVTINPTDPNAVATDAKAEADFFYQTAKPYLTAGNLLPALDLEDEEGNGGFNTAWTSSTAGWTAMASWVNAWTAEFQTHLPGVYPILYMTQSYAGNLAPLLDQSKYKLWIAIAGVGVQYNQPVIPPSGDSYWNPTIWPWVIEQYQTTDTAYPPDLDVINPIISLSSLEIGAIGSPDTTPPALAITSPVNGAIVTSASLVVSGTASDSGLGNSGVSSVTVNGMAATGDTAIGANTANWNATVTLNSGANTVTVIATDGVGNSTQQQITVTYNSSGGGGGGGGDTTPPTISITSPTSNSTYNTYLSSINIGGAASDNVGVTQVTWNNNRGGSGTASGTTSWTANGINLQSGLNVITVTAHDAAGNTGPTSLSVNLMPLPSLGGSSVVGGQLQTTLSNLSPGAQVILQVSTDLKSWTPIRTNTVSGSTLTITNNINPAISGQFFRAEVQ